MDPKTYQELAARTETIQFNSLQRFRGYGPITGTVPQNDAVFLVPVRLNHAALGISAEGGELLTMIQRWLFYGKFDKDKDWTYGCPTAVRDNFKEELGDVMWYVALACNALGLDLNDVMESNIAKLRQRYPDKFTEYHAADENRDRAKEMAAVTKTVPVYDQRGGKHELIGNATLNPDGTAIVATLRPLDDPKIGERFVSFEPCDVPPKGWKCTRPKGHEGPCAAVTDNAVQPPQQVGNE